MSKLDHILNISNLSKNFGGLSAVKNCSLKIKRGSITGIIGPNGSGKTTLFNLIAGSLKPNSGKVFFNNENITGVESYDLFSKGILRTFQIAQEFSNLTVIENLMMVPPNQSGENLINALSFQALPRVFGIFRYSGIGKTSSSYIDSGYSYWDRSFDVRVNLIKQNEIIPDLTIGLKDIIGTGMNQSEYIVASKDLLKNLSTSIGLGWGRLGTSNVIGKIGERNIQNVGRGGKLAYQHFFTGNVGLFYGLNYKPTGNLSLKAELSSDSYRYPRDRCCVPSIN